MTDPIDLNLIRKALAEATPGPWKYQTTGQSTAEVVGSSNWPIFNDEPYYPHPVSKADMQLVVLLRNNAEALLARVERAERIEAAAREYRRKVECYEEMLGRYGPNADVTFDIGRQTGAAGILLDAALDAALGGGA